MTRPAAPRFAMSFTQNAVILETRGPQGWRRLGRAFFEGGDLATRLGELREQALGPDADGADTGGPDTLVVIPDDQILYTTLTVAPGLEPADAVARALDGLTPYRVEDLAFDWARQDGSQDDTMRVAAVARQTLVEAEEFASRQGFRPQRFISRPGPERFPGEADFGVSELARQSDRIAQDRDGPVDVSRAGVTAPEIEDPDARRNMTAMPCAPAMSRIIPHRLFASLLAPQVSGAEDAAPLPQAAPAPTPRLGPAADAERAAVRPAPSPIASTPVIRHATAAGALSPRATAIHSRAAEARTLRAAAPSEVVPVQTWWTKVARNKAKIAAIAQSRAPLMPRIGTLPAMLGLLAVGFVGVLLFLGNPATQPQVPADRVQALEAETVVAPPTEIAVAPAVPVDLVPAETDLAEQAPPEDQVDPVLPVTPQLLPNTQVADDTPPSVDAPAPNETAATDPHLLEPEAAAPPSDAAEADVSQDALMAALTEAMQTKAVEDTTEPTAGSSETAATPLPATGPSPAPPTTIGGARPVPAPQDAAPRAPLPPPPVREATTVPAAAPAQLASPRPPARPRSRPAVDAPAPAPVAIQAPDPAPAPTPSPAAATASRTLTGGLSQRPPARPATLDQGSAPEPEDEAALTPSERESLEQLQQDLRTARLGTSGMTGAEREFVERYAQARPLRRPGKAGTDAAVTDAIQAALAPSPRPEASAASSPAPAAAAAGKGNVARSPRPAARPAKGGSTVNTSVEAAVAAAVAAAPVPQGAVPLTSLTRSMAPPRRTGARQTAAASPAQTPAIDNSAQSASIAAAAAAAAQQSSLAAPQRDDAAIAAQRAQDEALQQQAEARARARAAADAAAEAKARAAAEARARAQAEAEARAAAARNARYTPPEAEKEPEAMAAPNVASTGSVAASATVKDGITLNRTQIIGTIGAGQGSRALVRLSNGRVITLRLGDRINGGTITDIGSSKITYNKGGRAQALPVLDGR